MEFQLKSSSTALWWHVGNARKPRSTNVIEEQIIIWRRTTCPSDPDVTWPIRLDPSPFCAAQKKGNPFYRVYRFLQVFLCFFIGFLTPENLQKTYPKPHKHFSKTLQKPTQHSPKNLPKNPPKKPPQQKGKNDAQKALGSLQGNSISCFEFAWW